jgi:hypothetical protein
MHENPIVEEVHRIREKMLAEYNGDLRALMRDMRRRTEEAARAGRKVVKLAPRKVRTPRAPTKRAG